MHYYAMHEINDNINNEVSLYKTMKKTITVWQAEVFFYQNSQTGQVRLRIYLPKLKFSCPQKCICLAMSKC